MTEKRIIMYSQPGWPPCYHAKAWLTEQEIPFEVRDIRQNTDYIDELINLGASMTPTFVIAEQVLIGFQPDELKKAWFA
jgi:glutaredoxin